jgi:hypothetical protein
MGKLPLLVLALFCSLFCFGQTETSKTEQRAEKPTLLPEKEGSVFYELVLQVDSSLKKDVLFNMAKLWLARNLNDS